MIFSQPNYHPRDKHHPMSGFIKRLASITAQINYCQQSIRMMRPIRHTRSTPVWDGHNNRIAQQHTSHRGTSLDADAYHCRQTGETHSCYASDQSGSYAHPQTGATLSNRPSTVHSSFPHSPSGSPDSTPQNEVRSATAEMAEVSPGLEAQLFSRELPAETCEGPPEQQIRSAIQQAQDGPGVVPAFWRDHDERQPVETYQPIAPTTGPPDLITADAYASATPDNHGGPAAESLSSQQASPALEQIIEEQFPAELADPLAEMPDPMIGMM